MNDSPYAREPSSLSMQSLSRIGRLVRKELTEILRDRRTILTLVLMPLLLYPLLTLAFQQYFMAFQVNNDFRLAFSSQEDWDVFSAMLEFEPDTEGWVKIKESPIEKPQEKKSVRPRVRFMAVMGDNVEQAVRERQADVGVRLKNLDDLLREKTVVLDVEFIFQPESSSALTAQSVLDSALANRNSIRLEPLLKRIVGVRRANRIARLASIAGVMGEPTLHGPLLVAPRLVRSPPVQTPPNRLDETRMMRISKAPLEREASTGQIISLAALVPFILILMTITGAVYPAIDLTAGERERGTLEILVAAPVPRLALLFAKYVAVLSVAILTALINMSAMFVTLKLSGFGQLLLGTGEISVGHVLALLGLLILFAAFFSAVLLILTSFARSFKEAQAYLIPLMLASLGPGLAGMIPGLTLDGTLAVTPLVNIVLLARDVFESGATPLAVTLVITSTLLYAAAAIAVAARIFGAEEVLYSEQSGWSDMLSRPRKTQPTATLSNALVCLALMVPVNFVLRGLVMSLGEPDIATLLIFMSVDSLLLFVLLPGVAAFWSRLDWRQGFSLHRAPLLTLVGGLLLGLSLWPMIIEVMRWLHVDLQPEAQEQAKRLVEQMKSAGVVLAVPLALAALTEELFFRGYLFAALQRVAGPVTVIVVTAVLFGVMHSVVGGSIGAKQLIPATIMGLILGCVRWRTKSVLPSMGLHVVHNVILSFLLVSLDESANEDVPPLGLVAEKLGVPLVEFLTAVVLGIAAGAFLVYWGARHVAGQDGAPVRSAGTFINGELQDSKDVPHGEEKIWRR